MGTSLSPMRPRRELRWPRAKTGSRGASGIAAVVAFLVALTAQRPARHPSAVDIPFAPARRRARDSWRSGPCPVPLAHLPRIALNVTADSRAHR